jgi:hypothetical protein
MEIMGRKRLGPARAGVLVAVGLSIVAGVGAMSAFTRASHASQSGPSLAVALDHWQSNLDAIESIDVTFEVKAKGDVAGTTTGTSERIVVQGDRVYMDETLTFKGAQPGLGTLRREFIFDGKSTTLINHTYKQTIIDSGRKHYARVANHMWFDAAMVCRPDQASPEVGANMPAVLASPHTTLRPTPEVIDGVECWVADVTSPRTGDVIRSLWLDPARGYLPVRQRCLGEGGKAIKEVGCTEAIEVFNGCWLLTKGWHLVIAADPTQQDETYHVEVVVDGKPKLIVNGVVPEGQFVASIPSGHTVLMVGQKTWIQP